MDALPAMPGRRARPSRASPDSVGNIADQAKLVHDSDMLQDSPQQKYQGLRARQVDARRRHLLRTARTLLSAPSGGFSMTDLATSAGFSPTTPYNLFGTKANLLAALFAADIAGFHRSIAEAEWGDAVATIFGVAEMLGAEVVRRPDFYRNLRTSMLGLTLGEVRPLILRLNEEMLLPFIEKLSAEGAFEAWISPDLVAGHVTRLHEAASFHWSSGEWSPERFVTELRFGFGMALLGSLRTPLRQQMRRELRAMTRELRVLQLQTPVGEFGAAAEI
jgi:AcrR family transcriptional regulator